MGHFTDRDLWQSAKALSYSFLTAIPPMLVFLFSSIAYFPVDGVQDQLLLGMQQFIPEGIYGRVADTVNDIMGHRHVSLLSIGFIASIVLAANGMYGMMMSFNFMDHESSERPLWLRYAISLVLVVLLYFLIMVVLTLLIGYQLLEKLLISRNILAESQMSLFFFSFGRWVILIFVTLLIISVIYYIAPIRKRRISFFSFGSVLATLMFFALAWAFQAYLKVFNNYNILYGSIGTLLVLMLWVYANCVVILVGYGINIAIADARGEQGVTLKINHKKKHGTQFKQPCHRPVLRTDSDGFRQRHGSKVWFGPFGSVRYPSVGSFDGEDSDKQP
ncbi:MAG: YihY/virulence factor BrkB family protein [Bacteroidales bacterium]|nr:YihY/virulence factor BrkB family protein [Bacteroidales bacterium]